MTNLSSKVVTYKTHGKGTRRCVDEIKKESFSSFWQRNPLFKWNPHYVATSNLQCPSCVQSLWGNDLSWVLREREREGESSYYYYRNNFWIANFRRLLSRGFGRYLLIFMSKWFCFVFQLKPWIKTTIFQTELWTHHITSHIRIISCQLFSSFTKRFVEQCSRIKAKQNKSTLSRFFRFHRCNLWR